MGVSSYLNGYVLLSLVHMGGWDDAMEVFADINDTLHFDSTYPCSYKNHSTFWEYERNVTDVSNGSFILIENNLVQATDLNSTKFGDLMTDAITEVRSDPTGGDYMCTATHIGGE